MMTSILKDKHGSSNLKDRLNESEVIYDQYVQFHTSMSQKEILKATSMYRSMQGKNKEEEFTIDMFKFKRQLGHGSFGTVHLVKR